MKAIRVVLSIGTLMMSAIAAHAAVSQADLQKLQDRAYIAGSHRAQKMIAEVIKARGGKPMDNDYLKESDEESERLGTLVNQDVDKYKQTESLDCKNAVLSLSQDGFGKGFASALVTAAGLSGTLFNYEAKYIMTTEAATDKAAKASLQAAIEACK